MLRVIGIIPARYESTRLPGKPLVDILGKPMIQHVYENASRAETLGDLLVATDDERIAAAVDAFGGKVVLTAKEHATGTDRVAEVVRPLDVDIVVNVQGDEPFARPGMIDEIVRPLLEDPALPMSTLSHEIKDREGFEDPNVVKVVSDLAGNALYFSRSLIPHPRKTEGHRVFEHIGLYAYRRDFLMELAGLVQTPLEKAESLEQLRALERGYRIRVVETKQDYIPLNVNTPADLEKARILAARGR